MPLELVDQPDRRVMLDAQSLRDRPNRRAHTARKAANREQHLVLLWLDARVARRLLAEGQELSHLVTKRGKLAITSVGQFWHRCSRRPSHPGARVGGMGAT